MSDIPREKHPCHALITIGMWNRMEADGDPTH